MTAPLRLAAFAVALAALFGAATVAGDLLGSDRRATAAPAEPHASRAEDGDGGSGAHGSGAPRPVRGLAVAEDGMRLVVGTPELRRGRSASLAFRIVDDAGESVRDFDVEHEKRMHLILVRRDLAGFQHLHPRQDEDGTWRTDVRLDEAGSYRIFADFARDGESHTLASDLRVDGGADLMPLPPPARTAVSDGGYAVSLDARNVRPGREAELRFTISRDGQTVQTEPYLGAGGHLVALREGDLAFLHVHPTENAARDRDDSIGFAATFPTEGRYRLFLQFQHQDRVHTVAFTREVR